MYSREGQHANGYKHRKQANLPPSHLLLLSLADTAI